ncbi:MAG: hypothetical protein Q9162_003651 [Coniocarpon cinnabarinum]
MSAAKRASQEVPQLATKRVRLSNDELEGLTRSGLIAMIKSLEDELEIVKTTAAAKVSGNTNEMTEQKARQQAEKANILMVKGIKSQMKWKPACKKGAAKFSYTGALSSTEAFNVLTRQGFDAKKPKKLVQFSVDEFEDQVAKADMSASVRFGSIYITGKGVNLGWKEDDQTFTATGSYGLAIGRKRKYANTSRSRTMSPGEQMATQYVAYETDSDEDDEVGANLSKYRKTRDMVSRMKAGRRLGSAKDGKNSGKGDSKKDDGNGSRNGSRMLGRVDDEQVRKMRSSFLARMEMGKKGKRFGLGKGKRGTDRK